MKESDPFILSILFILSIRIRSVDPVHPSVFPRARNFLAIFGQMDESWQSTRVPSPRGRGLVVQPATETRLWPGRCGRQPAGTTRSGDQRTTIVTWQGGG